MFAQHLGRLHVDDFGDASLHNQEVRVVHIELNGMKQILSENENQIEEKRKEIESIEEEKEKKLSEDNLVKEKYDRGHLVIGKYSRTKIIFKVFI